MLERNTTQLLLSRLVCAFSVLIVLLISSNSRSQEYSKLDSIVTGKTCKIILFDETEIIGKVTKQDSLSLTMLTDNKLKTVVKDDIFNISFDLSPSKYNFILSAGGGISFLIGENRETHYRGYDPQFSLQLNGIYPFSDSKGVRADISYSKFKKDKEHYLYYGTGTEGSFEGGDMHFYSVKADFIFGLLRPSAKFMVFGSAGLGLHVTHTDESIETVYFQWDSTWHTYINRPEEYVYADLSLGAGAGYRFYKNWGFYLDVQYNIITAYGYFILGPTYVAARGGLFYTF